jgi:hypothetical protein
MLNLFKIFNLQFCFYQFSSTFALMKKIAQILLIIFIAFLSTPPIVTMIEKSCDVSAFYSLSEEEHAHKEIKTFVYHHLVFQTEFVLAMFDKSNPILSEKLSKHDKISASIFAPPPNFA